MIRQILIVLISAIFVENFVLAKFLGICPFLGVSQKLESAVGMSIAVTAVMAMATAATWPIYTYILLPDYKFLYNIVFILIIAALVQLVETVLKKYVPALYRSLGIYLPLITTNCAVLGVTILNIEPQYTFFTAMINAVGAGLGFLLAMVIFSGVRSRVDVAMQYVPAPFRGIPITLAAAAIVSMAFMGFNGVVEGLFG